MFYNDPTLYGATLPVKDVPYQSPFFGQTPFFGQAPRPWQQFLPQTFGHGYADIHRMPFLPFQQYMQFPQLQQSHFVPPFYGFTPQMATPFFGWQRPWIG